MCLVKKFAGTVGQDRWHNPSFQTDHNFKASMLVTAPLRKLIPSRDGKYSLDEQMSTKSKIRHERYENSVDAARQLKEELTPSLKRAMALAEVLQVG